MKISLGKRLIAGAAGLLILILTKSEGSIALLAYVLLYLLLAYDMIAVLIKQIRAKNFLNENFLMIIATIGAFLIGENIEALEVVLIFRFGELLEKRAVNKSRQSIKNLMDISSDTAHLVSEDNIEDVDPFDVETGSLILIKKGEKIPLDGVVEKGESLLDTKALTGESLPREIKVGDTALSGSILLGEAITIRTTKSFENSTATRILELVENAAEKKAPAERTLTHFAKYYTPLVVALSILVFLIPILFFGGETSIWFKRALIFLVVSCPCALVLSVPLTFFASIGAATKQGILFKGGASVETLSKVKTVVFDKTGTLTKGELSLYDIKEGILKRDEILKIAAHMELNSSHPLAKAIVSAYKGKIEPDFLSDVKEIEGRGMSAKIGDKTFALGSERLIDELNVSGFEKDNSSSIAVHLSADGAYAGGLYLKDEVKSEAKNAVDMLHKEGIEKTVLLSGDRKNIALETAKILNIDSCEYELLPQDKVSHLETLLNNIKGKLAFVGDGINDAPSLTRADVGIAMGAIGSDAAIEAADIVIMDDNLKSLSRALWLSKRAMKIVFQNIVFSMIVKALIMALGVFGLVGMHIAVFGDVGVALLAILNAMRVLKTKSFS